MKGKISLVEVILIVCILGILVLMFGPTYHDRSKIKATAACMMNLKSIGTAKISIEADQTLARQIRNPGLPTAAWRYFLTLSNYTGNARILACSADKQRIANAAEDYGTGPKGLGAMGKRDHAVSYFAGLGASEATAQLMMAGDRNLSSYSTRAPFSSAGRGAVTVGTNVAWTAQLPMHPFDSGSILFADGHVELLRDRALAEALSVSVGSHGTNASLFLFPQ